MHCCPVRIASLSGATQSIISLLNSFVHSTPDSWQIQFESVQFMHTVRGVHESKVAAHKIREPDTIVTHGTHERYQPIRLQTQRKLTEPFGGIPVSGPPSARFIHTAVSLACGCVTARDRRGSGCVVRVAPRQWPCGPSHFRADCRCHAARSVCDELVRCCRKVPENAAGCRRRGNTCKTARKLPSTAVRYIDR